MGQEGKGDTEERKDILVVYRVWYWKEDEICLVPCGKDGRYAWAVMKALLKWSSRRPFVEFIKTNKMGVTKKQGELKG